MELAIPAVIGGTGLTAISQLRAGAGEDAEFQQRAAMARGEGLEAERIAKEEARHTRAEGRRLAARQRVRAAKSGVKSYTGTPLLLQRETLTEVEKEADIITSEGITARNRLFSQAKFEERTGRRRRRAGVFGAGATLMTGLGGLGLALRA
jgi:hypothetical protein